MFANETDPRYSFCLDLLTHSGIIMVVFHGGTSEQTRRSNNRRRRRRRRKKRKTDSKKGSREARVRRLGEVDSWTH